MALRHTQRRNVYHICSRCGTWQPLGEMRWQNGILVCFTNHCVDGGVSPIIGSRDINVARQASIYRHELEPDPKLVSPVNRKNDQEEVLYATGDVIWMLPGLLGFLMAKVAWVFIVIDTILK
jgi:hypothetical protein